MSNADSPNAVSPTEIGNNSRGSAGQLISAVADGRIFRVTLSNPPDNRLTFPMLEELAGALDRFESDASLELLLLQGSKTTFSKGFDVSALNPEADLAELRRSLILSNAVFSRLATLSKPTVAAISGACLGGGLELALACHFRLCSDRARLGLPEIWIKLIPGLGGVFRLAKLIGRAKAMEMVMLGDLLGPEDALRVNLVNRIFPKAEFAERVDGFLNALLMADAGAIREAIALFNAWESREDESHVRRGMEAFARRVDECYLHQS